MQNSGWKINQNLEIGKKMGFFFKKKKTDNKFH